MHDAFVRDPAALTHAVARAESPSLGTLADAWLVWLRSAAALSRRRQPFAAPTIHRYGESWARLFRVPPTGRDATLADLTKGFLADYRERRRAEGRSGATINRDLVALNSFLSWCQQERGLTITRAKTTREREGSGRSLLRPSTVSAGVISSYMTCGTPSQSTLRGLACSWLGYRSFLGTPRQ